MITYVSVSDPDLAVELFMAHLLYCHYGEQEQPSIAGRHWSPVSIRCRCRQMPLYFCYALEE